MRVSDSQRVLFVHVQKTGGATIEQLMAKRIDDLRWVRERHLRLDQILSDEPRLTDYWTFGFVRNPWARIWSWWSMLHIAAASDAPHNLRKFEERPAWAEIRPYCGSFETFILQGFEAVERLRTPQLNYLRTSTKRADFIGRTETLAEDVAAVMRHLELRQPKRLPYRHRGKMPGHYRDFYTPKLRDAVADTYRVDIEEFGYEF